MIRAAPRALLLAGLALASCLPAWAKRDPQVSWKGPQLTVFASGGVEDANVGVVCEGAFAIAEKRALDAAAMASLARDARRPPPDPSKVDLEIIETHKPARRSCWVLVRLTVTP